ncbi:MAG: hypothetical protein IH999_07155 [Proteobacteria bacterium]|nr:hypothetical protein [Pseudomonadota bacterium]
MDFGIKRGGVDGLDGGSSGAGQRQRGECGQAGEGKSPRGGSDPKTVSVVPWHGTLNNGWPVAWQAFGGGKPQNLVDKSEFSNKI